MLPSQEGDGTAYRVSYAVHRLLSLAESNREPIASTAEPKQGYEIIGLVLLKPEAAVPLHDHITKKTDQATGHLRLEMGYLFLPTAWGNGFATEACSALLEACRRSRSFFAPFKSLYVEAVVSPDNPASMKVLEKAGLKQVGLNEWDGEAVFLAGALRDPVVWVYGIRVF
jgi:RimJ/RimL family protein N-acetyltransferase